MRKLSFNQSALEQAISEAQGKMELLKILLYFDPNSRTSYL